ncbi:hypothetical protein [Halapricum hydrolyticum]|uniref:Uncharacterized protein n=1 Tax=Halapricum hydrolyticum TaxID=2979991 RepID=A0AAE3IB36_9EURY|nr:hypothetical protein [Halapricum hydrolyticum]MCU4717589.1 hypothetical protein [Halapricum hydrolyticum]MCU4726882.1 hypothetical protein [Halapricum hydrolyticum]
MELVSKEGVESYRAEELYQGRQQKRITEAKQILEQASDDVGRVFISAGFGVVDGSDELPLYDVTFADMNSTEIDERAEKLGIQEDLHDIIVGGEYDIIFFALGGDYYRSAGLDKILPDVSEETYVVFFNREDFEEEYNNGLSIPARTSQAKAYGTIVIALKGEYLRNFASHRAAGKDVEGVDDIKDFCEQEASPQSGLDDYSSSN